MAFGWLLGGLIVVLLLLLFWGTRREGFSDVVYLDQVAMHSWDPMYVKYGGYERDVLGQSMRDYYLENNVNYLNGIAPGYFAKDRLFYNQDGYISMPVQYRARVIQREAPSPIEVQRSGDGIEEKVEMDMSMPV